MLKNYKIISETDDEKIIIDRESLNEFIYKNIKLHDIGEKESN